LIVAWVAASCSHRPGRARRKRVRA
jgi:hypothetical protein